jgi:glyoxylase-like metal-dependent hydrolase (beta-lactamase superfamily II)
MTNLTRRAMLAGSATAIAAGSLSEPLRAAAPAAGKQAPGFYRYKVGSYELTVVSDGVRTAPLADNFVRNAKKDEVRGALQAAFMAPDKVVTPFNPVVVNTGSKLVLIDTGLGAGVHAQSKGALGQLASNLPQAGIDAKTIDTVIITHCHPDHINGLVGADGKPAFANAEVFVPAPEIKFWNDDAAMNKAPAGLKGNFNNTRRVFKALDNKMTPYEAGKEIAPGITSVASHGHTPGHMSLVIASGNGKMFVQADVTNVPYLFARNPGWHVMFDMNGAMAEATRRKVYDMLVAEKMLMQGFHYPFPAIGYVEKSGNGYREVPVVWNSAL